MIAVSYCKECFNGKYQKSFTVASVNRGFFSSYKNSTRRHSLYQFGSSTMSETVTLKEGIPLDSLLPEESGPQIMAIHPHLTQMTRRGKERRGTSVPFMRKAKVFLESYSTTPLTPHCGLLLVLSCLPQAAEERRLAKQHQLSHLPQEKQASENGCWVNQVMVSACVNLKCEDNQSLAYPSSSAALPGLSNFPHQAGDTLRALAPGFSFPVAETDSKH